jgi:hypothetical protein
VKKLKLAIATVAMLAVMSAAQAAEFEAPPGFAPLPRELDQPAPSDQPTDQPPPPLPVPKVQPPPPAPVGPQVSQVWHNGSLMDFWSDPATHEIPISYAQPAPRLYGFVNPGELILIGRWYQNHLVATAYVFSRECGATPYRVEGGAMGQALVLDGAAPTVLADCSIGWFNGGPNSHLEFWPAHWR